MSKPTCATCLHLKIGRRVVRCGGKTAPREALPWLPACERWTEADDALNREWPAVVERGPWSVPEAPASHQAAPALRSAAEVERVTDMT